jgi:hypothetical protein
MALTAAHVYRGAADAKAADGKPRAPEHLLYNGGEGWYRVHKWQFPKDSKQRKVVSRNSLTGVAPKLARGQAELARDVKGV